VTGDLVTAGPDHASDGTAAVSGSIRGRDGWPLESATVTLVDRTGARTGRATVEAEGHCAVSVAETGAATLIVAAPGSVPVARSLTVPPGGLRLRGVPPPRPRRAR